MYKDIIVNVSGPHQAASQYKTIVLKGNQSFKSQIESAQSEITKAHQREEDLAFKFVIKFNFDLGGESVTIPANCVLEFNGGSLSNGTLVGNNTGVVASLTKIFDTSIEIEGTWNIERSYPQWFGAVGDGVAYENKCIALAVKLSNYCYIPRGAYLCKCPKMIPANMPDIIAVTKSNTTIEFENGATLIADDQVTGQEYDGNFRPFIVVKGQGVIDDSVNLIENINIIGGTFIGSRQYLNNNAINNDYENNSAIFIMYVKNLCVKDSIFKDCLGDSIYTACVIDALFTGIQSYRCRRSAIAIGLNQNNVIENCTFIDNGIYVEYANGNHSYGTVARSVICFEEEPAVYRAITNKTIDNIIIRNNTFSLGDCVAILGCCTQLVVENNIFDNIRGVDGTNSARVIYLTNSNWSDRYALYYNSIYYIKNNLVRANIISNLAYEQGFVSSARFAELYIESNTIYGIKAFDHTTSVDTGDLYILNNYIDNSVICGVRMQSGKTCVVKGNCGTFDMAIKIWNSVASQEKISFIVEDNQAVTLRSTSDVFSNALISLNTGTILNCEFIIRNNNLVTCAQNIVGVPFYTTDYILIQDNYIKYISTGAWFFLERGGNLRYVGADVIGNYFDIAVGAMLSYYETETQQPGVLQLINNVFCFRNRLIRLTTDTQSTEHLILKNNIDNTIHAKNTTLLFGNYADRPSSTFLTKGYMFFCVDRGKPIFWDGTNWVDATGAPV